MGKKHHSKKEFGENKLDENHKKKKSRHKKSHDKHHKKHRKECSESPFTETSKINTNPEEVLEEISERNVDEFSEDYFISPSEKSCIETNENESFQSSFTETSKINTTYEELLEEILDNNVDELSKDNCFSPSEKDCTETCQNECFQSSFTETSKIDTKNEEYLEEICEKNVDGFPEDYCIKPPEKECTDINLKHQEKLKETEDVHIQKTAKEDHKECLKTCTAEVEVKALSLCPNTPQTITGKVCPVVIKAPVVLAEPRLEISAVSVIRLENPALEIKRIKKNVYLKQCEILQDLSDPYFGTLFVVGFIRKNIEYATGDCYDKDVISGKIKHTTVKIPFTCATRVRFDELPVFRVTPAPVQVEFLRKGIQISEPCDEGITGHSPCQFNLRTTEFFNEDIFGELVSAEIIESDFLENPSKDHCEDLDRTYKEVREKVVVYLTIKLLQNQQIVVNKFSC